MQKNYKEMHFILAYILFMLLPMLNTTKINISIWCTGYWIALLGQNLYGIE